MNPWFWQPLPMSHHIASLRPWSHTHGILTLHCPSHHAVWCQWASPIMPVNAALDLGSRSRLLHAPNCVFLLCILEKHAGLIVDLKTSLASHCHFSARNDQISMSLDCVWKCRNFSMICLLECPAFNDMIVHVTTYNRSINSSFLVIFTMCSYYQYSGLLISMIAR